jgi:hypothetical protein
MARGGSGVGSTHKLGATVEEITEVIKLCDAQGVEICDLTVPIPGEELTAAADDERLAAVIELAVLPVLRRAAGS